MLLHKQLCKSCKRSECLENNKLNNIKIKRTDMGFDNLKRNWFSRIEQSKNFPEYFN